MTKRRGGKNVGSAKRSKRTNVVPFVPKERDWIDDQITFKANQKAHIFDVLSRYGIVFDETNEIDNLLAFQVEHSLIPHWGMISPHNLRQDSASKRSVENVVAAMEALKQAILHCLEQAERPRDTRSVNVARRFLKNVHPTYDLNPDEPEPIFDDLGGALARLDDCADRALKTGIAPRKGDAKQDPAYASFAWLLREMWKAKRPQDDGYYRSRSTWRGPFIEMVRECESVLPDEFRPSSDEARGKRLATTFGWGPTKRG